jgi:hypothetical protein
VLGVGLSERLLLPSVGGMQFEDKGDLRLSVDTVKNLLAWGEIGPDDDFESGKY